MEIKHIEAEDMKREMDEVQQRKYAEYDDLRSNVMLVKYPLNFHITRGLYLF